MNAVALVGPNTVCRDEDSSGLTIAAMAEQVMPYCSGNPAMSAYAMPCGMLSIATVTPARRSAKKLRFPYPSSDRRSGKGSNALSTTTVCSMVCP